MTEQNAKPQGDPVNASGQSGATAVSHTSQGYLDCLVDISTQLLSVPDPWSVLPLIIGRLRSISGVDRCYLIEHRLQEGSRWSGTIRIESVADGVVGHAKSLMFEVVQGPDAPKWAAGLSAGVELQGHVPAGELRHLPFLTEDVEWCMLLPLIDNQHIVGYLGFDICRPGIELDQQETARLRATVNIINAAFKRLAAERELQGAHALLTTILRCTGDLAVIATDLKLRVMHFNPVAEKMFELAAADVTGKRLDDLGILKLPGQDVTSDFLTALIGDKTLNVESEIPGDDGQFRTVEIQVSGMVDEQESPVGYLVTAQDVTDERCRQRRTLQSERMESVGMLAGGVAHDFNNILMGILGYASLAKDAVGPDHPALRMLNTIEQSGERAAALTSELLAYARGGKYQTVAVRLDEQVSELVNILTTNLPRGIRVIQDFVDELPYVLADPAQIQQVIMNLCLNAGDAIREQQQRHGDKDIQGKITFRTAVHELDRAGLKLACDSDDVEPGRFVVLVVEDNGCGMDQETLERIFEPFFTTKFTGRGLGLAAVEGIIRNHGGFMRVKSVPGAGTCFTIYLPATTIFAEPEAGEPALRLTGAETILFVDDEEMVRQLALLNLTNLGYQVYLASTGREAIGVLDEHRAGIDLIILDVVMPGMSAEATITELRRINPSIAILLTSGYDQRLAEDSATADEIAGFLQKPYTPEALSRAVRSILNESAPAD